MTVDPVLQIAAGSLGSLVVAAGTYFVARRRDSGQVATSDAAALWAEGQAMRRDLREEVSELRRELATTRKELTRVQGQASTLRNEVEMLREQVRTLRARQEGPD